MEVLYTNEKLPSPTLLRLQPVGLRPHHLDQGGGRPYDTLP
jgi:hypothetical protein